MKEISKHLLLTEPPVILTKDRDFMRDIAITEWKAGQVICIPDDAILIVGKADRDTVQLYNHPMFIVDDKQK